MVTRVDLRALEVAKHRSVEFELMERRTSRRFLLVNFGLNVLAGLLGKPPGRMRLMKVPCSRSTCPAPVAEAEGARYAETEASAARFISTKVTRK
jgi:hypothetical protein